MRPDTPHLTFWFDFGSTYAYLSALRVDGLAARAGVRVDWRPFLLGPIFTARGWPTSPFQVYPDKGRHMWRDVERRAALHGLPFRRPSAFPQNGLLASRLMLAGLGHGWAAAFAREVFLAEFARDEPISRAETLAPLIERAGGDPASALADAGSSRIKAALRRQTEEAAALGIFGAPTFVNDGEMFWGDDRLEEALSWCVRQHPLRPA